MNWTWIISALWTPQKGHGLQRNDHDFLGGARKLILKKVTRSRGGRGDKGMRELDDITGEIVDAALRIHRDLGPGLLESVYEALLARALNQRGFEVERQRAFRFEYQEMVFEDGFRVDLLVEARVIVEIKSVERLAPVHCKQLLTYLKLTNTRVGLLINFGAATLREGVHRIVNRLPASESPRLRVNRDLGFQSSP